MLAEAQTGGKRIELPVSVTGDSGFAPLARPEPTAASESTRTALLETADSMGKAESSETAVERLLRRRPHLRLLEQPKGEAASDLDSDDSSCVSIRRPLKGTPRARSDGMGQSPAPLARRIIRTHWLKELHGTLGALAENARKPATATYAARAATEIRALVDLIPEDPSIDLALGLHDALMHGNRWAQYGREQFEAAQAVVSRFLEAEPNTRLVRKALEALDDAGFDTMPYSIPDLEDLSE